MSDALTPEQARAVAAPGSIAVVAGAGTGKTKMLAHRYLHHLDQGLSALEIVAVTFTEKAAAELRSRIRSLVRSEQSTGRKQGARAGPERPGLERPGLERAGLERAAVEIEAAQISTIHALAARVCREHPLQAEVAPDFAILDDLEGVIWQAERLEEAIAALPATILDELEVGTLRFVLDALINDPLAAEAALTHGPEVWRSLLEAERTKALAAVLEGADWPAGRAALLAYSGDADDKGELARLACLRAMEEFEAGEFGAALELVKSFRTNVGRKDSWPSGGLGEIQAALKSVKELVRAACESDGRVMLAWDEVDDELARLVPLLREAFTYVSSHLEAARRRERRLDFSALEVHALRALSHREVVEFYARRWKAILVDEFQDTNPVQARLLELLSATADLTVVGDEKQAIYGFRGADITVFRGYREGLKAAGGDEVVLSRSFRSHAELTAAFDGVFPTLMGDLHQPLAAARTQAPGSGPYLNVRTVVTTGGRSRKAARRLSEAYDIAELISGLVAAATPIWDPELAAERPLRFGDIALLARGKAPFETYAQVLPALGVPAVDTGGGNLFETREARDGIAALRFVADPHDDIALAAVLRGPFFALDDRALLAFAGAIARGTSWWSALLTAEEGAWQRPRQVLGDLLELKWTLPPSRVLKALDEATGYAAVVANLPGGLRRLADWRGFLGLIRTLEADQSDAFAVSRRLRRLLMAELQVPRPTLQAGNAVAMMTIHKSKGLEWPVVIVADLSYEGGGGGRELFVDREHGLGLKISDETGESREPVLHRLLKLRAKEREEQELRRLFYVAFTRARDRLILTSSESGRGPLRFLEPALEAGGFVSTAVEHDPSLSLPAARLPDPADFGLTLDGG